MSYTVQQARALSYIRKNFKVTQAEAELILELWYYGGRHVDSFDRPNSVNMTANAALDYLTEALK